MKIALSQQNYIVADFDFNFKKIAAAVEKAKKDKAELIVFSEFAVCGAFPFDLIHLQEFIQKSQETINQLAALSNGIGIVVGSPYQNNGKIYNAACFLSEGKMQAIQPKIIRLEGIEAEELRYFSSGEKIESVYFKGQKIVLSVGNSMLGIADDSAAELHINISATPFSERDFTKKFKVNIPLISVNQVGANTDEILYGASYFANSNGEIIEQLPYFEESLTMVDTEKSGGNGKIATDENELICRALILGIKDYCAKTGFKKAILGLSGGLDSALVAYFAVRALGEENVLAVLLPSMHSSEHSVTDADKLVENLGCKKEKLAITDVYNAFIHQLEPLFEGRKKDITEENLQARIRANLLMSLSNKFGYILLNTSNKSEIAVGYGTLYGDSCGSLSVLGDVYKTKEYELARYINRNEEIIPNNILTKAPSAELSPGQKDSDSLPEYPVLDKLLVQYIEEGKNPSEMMRNGDKALVERVIKLVNKNEYKRYQSGPILHLSSKPFGAKRNYPIVKGELL